jgi:hypothetical protein
MILLLTIGSIGIILLLLIVLFFVSKNNTDKKQGEDANTDEPDTKPYDLPGNSIENIGDETKNKWKRMFTELLTDKMTYINLGGQLAISVAVDKIMTRIDERVVQNQIQNGGRRTLNKLGERSVDRLLSRLGTKIFSKSGEKALVKAATRGGVKLAAKAATAPIQGAMFAFDVMSGTLDGLNAGGFANMQTLENFQIIKTRADEDFKKEVGEEYPIVYGPFDTVFENDLYDSVMKNVYKLMGEVLARNETIDLNRFDEFVEQSIQKDCSDRGGFYTDSKKCSFTKENCLARWPLNTGDTYYEFKEGVCQIAPSIMRSFCERIGLDVSYDTESGRCRLSDKYCRRYGATGLNSQGDCRISGGQEFAENLIGTTIVRSLVNIFDPDNFEPCTGDWEPVPPAMTYLGYAFPPAIIANMAHLAINDGKPSDGLSKYFCQRKGGLKVSPMDCPPDMDRYGLHCYHKGVDTSQLLKIPTLSPCPPGTRDDGTSCWEDFKCRTKTTSKWDASKGGFFRTTCSGCVCIKKTKFQRLQCPNGYYSDGVGMCYARSALLDNVGTCPQGKSRSAAGLCSTGASLRLKKRAVPYPSTSAEDVGNSAIGRQVNTMAQGIQEGDSKKFMIGMYGTMLTTNPAVLSMGASDMVAMGWEDVTESSS